MLNNLRTEDSGLQKENHLTNVSLLDNVQFIYELVLAQLELSSFNLTFELKDTLKDFIIEINSDLTIPLKRLAYFKQIDSSYTDYYHLLNYNQTKSVNQYLTHWFYPYKGKFHPQMVRSIFNIMKINSNETVLDPFIGSGTTALESQLLGINSIGFDLSPLCILQSNVKINSIGSLSQIKSLREQAIDSFNLSMSSNNIMEGLTSSYSSFLESIDDVNTMNFFKLAQLLAISEKVRRNRKFLPSFVKNLDKMISSLNDYVHAIDALDLNLGKPDVRKADARKLPLVDSSIDGIVTSPPYSIALDYVSNDSHSLKALGHDLDDLRNLLIGVRGKGAQKISAYNEDMIKCFSEMYRVLRQGKYCAIVIGDATYQNSKINTIDFTINECEKLGFTLVQNLNKTIFGLYNVMQTDNTLIFLKE